MRPTLRTAFLVVAATVLALLTAACGGGGEQEGGQTASTPAAANEEVTVDIVSENVLFDKEWIEVPAGSTVKVVIDNRDAGVLHNFALYETSEAKDLLAGTSIEAGPLIQELTFEAPAPGEYFYRCDVHPTTMIGTFAVKWVMVGWRRPAQITTDLRRLLRPGVKFLQAEVQEPGAADGTIGFIVSGSFTLWWTTSGFWPCPRWA